MIYLKNMKKIDRRTVEFDVEIDETLESAHFTVDALTGKVLTFSTKSIRGNVAKRYEDIVAKVLSIGQSKDFEKGGFAAEYKIR